jgi:hypothetical protein
MPLTNISPNVDEFVVAKGIITIQPGMTGPWLDLGNVPEFEFSPTIEELEHFTSRTGVKLRDKTIALEKGGDLRMVMEEWTAFNMALALLSEVDESSPPGESMIDILKLAQFSAAVRFQGMNDVGPRWNFQFNRVDFIPSSSMNLISDEWAGLEVTGHLAATDIGGGVMSFGTATRKTDGTSIPWPSP